MSSANTVPETWELTGSDAKETLREVGLGRLFRDAFQRLRAADGFSHARSMAFLTVLILVQGVIALVGFVSAAGEGRVSNAIETTLHDAYPEPAGSVLTDAIKQAHEAGAQGRYLALTLGTVAALITGTTLLGQIERAMNRIYGIERDRPTARKYGRAFVLALSAGILSVAGFVAMSLGDTAVRSLGGGMADVWRIVRWPLAVVLLIGATACVFRWSPRRHQPAWSWLALGATASVALVVAVTLALHAILALSASFGETYGPLAGFVALLLWGLLSSLALLYGVAIAAQLEAVCAGVPDPRRAGSDETTSVDTPPPAPTRDRVVASS